MSIDLRPAVVDAKTRIVDWELDTITVKNSKGYLITVVERKSKLTLIKRLPDRQSEQIAKAVVQLLRPYKDKVLTITVDNAREFARHAKISKSLKAQFPDPPTITPAAGETSAPINPAPDIVIHTANKNVDWSF